MIGFGAPLILAGLAVLPVIWWLLRLTPPRPQVEAFPPLEILARILRREETPERSPWWLTALRLTLAALVIFALARPMLNPQAETDIGDGLLALLIDNSWISGADWNERVVTARALIEAAGERGAPVALAFSAMPSIAEAGPFDAGEALKRLDAAAPQPVSADRVGALARLSSALKTAEKPAVLALLSDGLADDAVFAPEREMRADGAPVFGSLLFYAPSARRALALTNAENGETAMRVTATRDPAQTMAASHGVSAFDGRNRLIAGAVLEFADGAETATADIALPFELRNDIALIAVDGAGQAGAVRLIDQSSGRRRVALIAATGGDGAQPLLSPLHYLREALAPFSDIVEPAGEDIGASIAAALDTKPSVIVLADIGVIPDAMRAKLAGWMDAGGTLIRFSGPRLAAAEPLADDPLLPVRLRTGERALDGALSWSEPQPVAAFPNTGPFAGLAAPQDVSVRRQVLAEPGLETPERTWASLADGTPLVTGRAAGRGSVVLFHVGSDAVWSNLPISGTFVDMLRRLTRLSAASGLGGDAASAALPPLRTLDAAGRLRPPPTDTRPLAGGATASFENPPGLYGVADAFRALNLFEPETSFRALEPGAEWPATTRAAYVSAAERDLRGPLFTAALVLLVVDALAVLWMAGALRVWRRAGAAAPAALLAFALLGAVAFTSGHALAQVAAPAKAVSEADAIDAVSQTRIAYVPTGDAAIDAITEAGISGLTEFIASRTALEPGAAMAVNPETDELSFYPLIYWPIDAAGPAPSAAALARIDTYMKNGGTVLFDTRDQLTSGLDAAGASPAALRLRDMLSGMNVPPLEPVPADHVLTKSFFILTEFPGRYRGSPLWVEAAGTPEREAPARPVRALDGVTPIMITGNDFAAAWAADSFGDPLLPTVPDDPLQRVLAYRAGVNIMMVMLTGNYKSDQVHVPALLERLGQ